MKPRSTGPSGVQATSASVANTAAKRSPCATPLYLNSQPTASTFPFMSSWLSFLASRGARLTATGVADFGEPVAETVAARDYTILADLSDNALLAVTGDDAADFLHAQLTNDVQSLPVGA